MKIMVAAHEKGLLFRDGRFIDVLGPGRYRLARWLAKEEIKTVDLRLRTLVLQGQEIMTLDKVTVRITMLAKMNVADPVAALLKVDDYAAQLYGDIQLALRDAVGALELEAAIGRKGALGEAVVAAVKEKALVYGVNLVEAPLLEVAQLQAHTPAGGLGRIALVWRIRRPADATRAGRGSAGSGCRRAAAARCRPRAR